MKQNERKHIVYRPVGSDAKEKIIQSVYEAPKILDIKKSAGELKRDNEAKRKYLINKINQINFKDGTILVNFNHRKYSRTLSRRIKPLPCQNYQLDCLWAETASLHPILKSYQFQNLLIEDGNKTLLVMPEVIQIDKNGLSFKLPDSYIEVKNRRIKRHLCKGIKINLLQSSVLYNGVLLDFSAVSFRVGVKVEQPNTLHWVNPSSDVNVIFTTENGEVVYSGECRILKEIDGQNARNYVLEPKNYRIQRYKPIEYRSKRLNLVPTPDIVFTHPLTGKLIDLKVVDLSGSGCSVEEDEDSAVLLPGMIIPRLEISFSNSTKISCRAQVIYRNSIGERGNARLVKCGIAILDIELEDHMQLLAILNQAEDKDFYICNKVDMDSLWDFFFETGLIESNRYEIFQTHKEEIRETYEKLYTNHPNIARHFIYQDKGNILGHTAMLRFYEKSWLLQHHASRVSSLESKLFFLNQVSRFICDSYRLSSINMDYLINYFSHNNKFSNIIYRGAARNINNPKGCSIDTFAYFNYQRKMNDGIVISKPWRLAKALPEDLKELESYYEGASGGLMIHALDLKPGAIESVKLSMEYKKLGFKRRRYLLSLRKYDSLKAIIILDISNVCLNFYDLTNSIKIIALDPDDIPKTTLFLLLSQLCKEITKNEVPVLLYPVEYATDQSIQFEKLFHLWILNTQYSDQYYKHLNLLFEKRGHPGLSDREKEIDEAGSHGRASYNSG